MIPFAAYFSDCPQIFRKLWNLPDSVSDLLIGLVGPCGAGKTTAARLLIARGYKARAIAQEHSFVPDMWRKITNPDVLVFLHAGYPITMLRKRFTWEEWEYLEQYQRLSHAQLHADLQISTDLLTPEEVYMILSGFLQTFNPSVGS